MPLRNGTPLTFKPVGVSDALDGTNAFAGACESIIDMVPAPHTDSMFVPRPASIQVTDFAGFDTPTGVSTQEAIGDRVYGMVASNRFPGHDEPFCYDLTTLSFIPISGVNAGNVPFSLAPGDWTPPVTTAITASMILVAHIGFKGTANFFGWFDTSAFASTDLTGNTTNGSPVIRSISGPTSAPIQDGVQPGQLISGPGIPAGARVIAASNGTFDETTTGDTHSNNIVDNIPDTTGFEVGMQVAGPDFVAGTTIASITGPNAITISTVATGTNAGVALAVSGGGTITIDQNATATATGVALDITGGTAAAPLWGAGNTNTYPLPAVPIAVAQFNGRAYFGVDNSVPFSDSLFPLQRTNASQALILGDSQPVTALAGLPLTSQVNGGIIQSLIAFKGAQPFYQITGDFSNQTLAQSVVNGSVGTLSPNTITPTPLGLAFIAVDGLRILGLNAEVSDPIGVYGSGVCVPFLYAVAPSRMCAAYNENTLRVSVQNGSKDGQPYEEYWFNFSRKAWTGPHTFPYSLIQAVYEPTVGFVGSPIAKTSSLWASTALPNAQSTYVENGLQLFSSLKTSLLPDNQQSAENAIVELTIALALLAGQTVTVTASDEDGNLLDQVTLPYQPMPRTRWGAFRWGEAVWTATFVQTVWDQFTWGQAVWGSILQRLKQYRLPWSKPLVFKQMQVEVRTESAPGFAVGNIYARYQILGYMIQEVVQ